MTCASVYGCVVCDGDLLFLWWLAAAAATATSWIGGCPRDMHSVNMSNGHEDSMGTGSVVRCLCAGGGDGGSGSGGGALHTHIGPDVSFL